MGLLVLAGMDTRQVLDSGLVKWVLDLVEEDLGPVL